MTQNGTSSRIKCKPNRTYYSCLAGLLLILAFGNPALAARNHDCPEAEGNKTVSNLQSVQVELTATKNDDFSLGHACQAVVRDSAQRVIFSEEDFDFSLAISDVDLTGEGVPDLVLESYSGGAHCCWTYYIISLGDKPHLIKRFENERAAGFVRDQSNGHVEIVTQDGAFDSFDNQCHACTVFPVVYLRLERDHFVDVGAEHVKDYDEIIAKSQQALSAPECRSFQSAQGDPYQADDATDTTAKKILSIVFAYLYSGRESQARQVLQELWPSFDQERLWRLILETRQHGVLSQTRNPGH